MVASTSVEYVGPPRVMMKTRSNTFSPPMIDSIAVSARIGRMSGAIIRSVSCQALAPSTCAASNTSCGRL
jgi:hypothetical protein